jgi:hypothetical protein
MDITDTLAPKSDQMDYEDLMTAERTFTIKNVRKGPSAEQPVQIDLEEFDRPWRPAKSMRRVHAMAWGSDASKYAGRQVRLFGDSTVKWAGQEVGGIRIRALSHIPEALTVALTVTRGKRSPFIVQPLDPPKPRVDESGRDWLTELADTQGDVSAIEALGSAAKEAHAKEATLTVIRAAYKDALAGSQEPQS